jgi:RNA polymerase sigma-70 factor (family 1)
MADRNSRQDFSITRFREGKRHEFNYVFTLYYNLMNLFARNLVKTEREAKDIATESFIKLWKLHANFENLNNIKAFLYVTTRNASLDYLRFAQKQRAAQKELMHLLKEEDENDVSNAMIGAEVFNDLSLEIENLPPRCREVFKLIYFRSMGTAQVAEELNITARNVLNQKAKAIHFLRSVLLKKASLPVATLLLFGFLPC